MLKELENSEALEHSNYIQNLICKRIYPGDVAIITALEKFDCGNPSDPKSIVSLNMKDRFKNFLNGKKEILDAFYVIKESDSDDIILFFSLQASQLFSYGYINPQDLRKIGFVLSISKSGNSFVENYIDHETFKIQMEGYELKKYSDNEIPFVIKEYENISYAKKNDPSDNIYVHNIYPCIEMVNYCKNISFNSKWLEYGFKTALGSTLFWYKILPVIQNASDIIGCEYVTLFAADSSITDTDNKAKLIYYYQNALKFRHDTEFFAVKPKYDWKCILMYQKIDILIKEKDNFERYYLNIGNDDV